MIELQQRSYVLHSEARPPCGIDENERKSIRVLSNEIEYRLNRGFQFALVRSNLDVGNPICEFLKP